MNDAGYNIVMASGLLASMFWDCIRLDMDVYVSPVMKTCDGCASSGGIDRNVTKITLDDLFKYDFRR